MTVRLAEDGTIILDGACLIEDADPLVQFLLEDPGRHVDVRTCAEAHTAVIQILLAVKPMIRGPSPSPFLQRWIEPALSDAGL
jgi:hypothetical protein